MSQATATALSSATGGSIGNDASSNSPNTLFLIVGAVLVVVLTVFLFFRKDKK